MAVDLLQLSQLALYDGTGSTGALTFNDKDAIGPKTAEEESHLVCTYHYVSNIDIVVNVLIENMGLDMYCTQICWAIIHCPRPQVRTLTLMHF